MSFVKYLRRDSLLQLAGKRSLSRSCMLQTCRTLIIETAPPESVKLTRLSGSDSGNFIFQFSFIELVFVFMNCIVRVSQLHNTVGFSSLCYAIFVTSESCLNFLFVCLDV